MTLIWRHIIPRFSKARHTKFIILSLAIPFSGVLIHPNGVNIFSLIDTLLTLQFVVCCICIAALYGYRSIPQSMWHLFVIQFLLFISVILHMYCFVIRAIFGDEMMHNFTYLQYGNLLFGMFMYLWTRKAEHNDSSTQKARIRPPFRIDDQYQEAAKVIYDTIIALETSYDLHVFAQLLAEYGATQYVNCNQCKQPFGFVECWQKDFFWENRNIIFCTNNNDILYYLCCISTLEMGNGKFDYVERGYNEILCHDCGKKWRCTCHHQAFEFNFKRVPPDGLFTPGGCYYCKRNICEYCSLYVWSRRQGICEECYYDDDICEVEVDDNGIILDILN